jgi:ABC-type multidrug transport system fused ATPase/permease subunit
MAAAALTMAFVSAGGLGAGLLGLMPVLRTILGEESESLPTMAARGNAWLAKYGIGIQIPDSWIAALPTGRFDAVLWIIIGLGLLTLVGATANFLHAFLSLTLSTRVVADVRRAAFRRLVHLPLRVVVGGRGHDMTSRILNDTNVLNRGLQALTSKAIAHLTKGAAAIATAFYVSWRLSIVTVLIAPILLVIIRKLGTKIRRASRGAMKGQAKLLEVAGEVTRGFRVVKVYTAERYELGRFSRINKEVMEEMLRLRTAQALASPLMESVTIFILGGLSLVAVKAIIDNSLDATEFLLAVGSLALAGASLRPLSGVIQDIQTAEAAAQRIDSLLSAEPEDSRDSRRPRLARHAESLVFEKVTFTYDGQPAAAVADVSLTIRHGETVAFVGPNGCGKTTLLSLVPRLLEAVKGRVLIDGTDIAGVSLRSLRRQIGAVTQETVLFRGTIASNIAYGSPGATRAQIEDVAKRARAHEFITRQPDGYDTVVGDQGLTLSGGQRQRIAIARALLRNPAILIMDEATSMVDSESESQIAQAVEEFGRQRTCLIVAHRLTTVLGADRIVVMDQGRIVDSGRHGELLERCDLYRDLTRHQLAPATTSRA